MIRTTVIALILLSLVSLPAAAQKHWVRHSTLYGEALGSGGVASLNFEHLVTPKVAVRLGIGSGLGFYEEELVVPATVSFLKGGRNSFLELGVGMAFVSLPDQLDSDDLLYDNPDSHVAATGILGYRYQGDWGLFMRLAFTPMINEEGFVPLGGAALGYSF